MPIKKVKLKKLTQAQKDKLNKHAKKHSVKHMRAMRWDVMQGTSFNKAHEMAMSKHGK